MLDQKIVFDELRKHGITFFTGVPDSQLNDFCNYALFNHPDRNVIAANEGNAIGIASGYFFATREIPLVYMQNSGLGNAVNPLVSLANEQVYSVPMILLIGWRGQPGTGDWVQHKLQGEMTPQLLELMNIPYRIISDDPDDFISTLTNAVAYCRENRKAYALIVPKGVMNGKKTNIKDAGYPMSREEAIEIILDSMPCDTLYSATTGRATRELFFLRRRRNESGKYDFLNLGAMGHASSVALGIALERPDRKVVVLDGDAAAIMHMGAMTMVSRLAPPNYLHVVLNNGAHESVGGQPTNANAIDFTGIANACGYKTVGKPVETRDELLKAIEVLNNCGYPAFIDCCIHKGLRGPLPPLEFSQREAIDAFIDDINNK